MKQLLILSGKGGTGKTTVAGVFAALATNKVLADCDVDAADLHLLLAPERLETHDFDALPGAQINPSLCTGCGTCAAVCRFAAAVAGTDGKYTIDPYLCEGCRVCVSACPSEAISLQERVAGQWFISNTRFGPLVHARLKPGEENSGMLVAKVRQAATHKAEQQGYDLVIVDGPPGIGCPVISSLTGIDQVLIVTEPTVAGKHDLERVIKLARHFSIPIQVAINKWDLSPEKTQELEEYCTQENIPVVGQIPFDEKLVESTAAGKSAVEASSSPGAKALAALWENVYRILQ
ncbi:MAG: ATP-binding protein [bacterium]|jgi:MinD superfamily P-loop ATPase